MKKIRLKIMLLGLLTLLGVGQANAFCGFYVAKADAKLFNKSSQVIIARDGEHTVITMSSDYQGDAKDFAMVVPVPEVLKESDIRVVQQYIFDKYAKIHFRTLCTHPHPHMSLVFLIVSCDSL